MFKGKQRRINRNLTNDIQSAVAVKLIDNNHNFLKLLENYRVYFCKKVKKSLDYHQCFDNNQSLKKSICTNDFSFDLPTFVYGDEIETYQAIIVESNYILNKSYAIHGELYEAECKKLIDCILKIHRLKNVFKEIYPNKIYLFY